MILELGRQPDIETIVHGYLVNFQNKLLGGDDIGTKEAFKAMVDTIRTS